MKALGTKQLKTKRLVLREFRKEDIQSVYENYGSDPKVNRFIKIDQKTQTVFADQICRTAVFC